MAGHDTILVLGDHDTALSNLAERCRRIGYRAVRAETVEEAVLLSEDRGLRFGVAAIRPDWPVADMAAALQELRTRCRSPRMAAIATGTNPDPGDRDRLRRSGIELALWNPIGDHALRFQLNRAMATSGPDLLRGEERTPTGWRARVLSRGRAKAAAVYSISPDGAFLVTQRPTQRGTRIAIVFELPEEPLSVDAEVVYTNVPGNLQRRRLPDGMAVRFLDLDADAQHRLRRGLRDSASHYRV
jgi:hypothetical protein